MKGNPGGNPASLPNIPLSEDEMDLIDKLSRYRESFSHSDIAIHLNTIYGGHNKGTRTASGVQKYLSDPKRKEKRAAAHYAKLTKATAA
nr:hypothetical protein [uncultured Methanoregula sp.]